MTYHRGSVPVDGDWVWELPPDGGSPTALDCLARGEACLNQEAFGEALRQFGVALLLEPGMPRAQLGAALALDGLGHEQRAREILSVDGLPDRLGIDGLLAGLALAGRRGWREAALAFLVRAYALRPSPDDLARLNELATGVLDQLAPEVASTLPPEARPIRTLRARRNDPCPCGSGKKYKRCHLKYDQEFRGPAVRGESDNLAIVAMIREREGDYAGAAELWERLADRFPEVPSYWSRLGHARLELNQLRQALAAYERLERFPPSQWEDAVVDRARCLHRLGRRREALRALDGHPKATFGSAPALALRAELLSHLGRLTEARDDLIRATRLEPGRVDYLVQLAETHQALGETEASGQAALSALTLSSAETVAPEARLDLRLSAAAILAGLGWEPDVVLEVCAEVLGAGLDPAVRTQALAVRAYALLTLGRPADTAATVEEALALGENVELYLLGAAAASQLGDSQTRVTYLREGVRCLEEDQSADAEELAVGGLIAATLGHFDRALALADRALAADAESEVALPVRAHCLLRLDRTEEALATAGTPRAAELSSPLLVLTRAEALIRLGRHTEALAELAGPLPLDTGPLAPLLTQLQEVQPTERRDLLRGRALRRLGREAEALDLLRDVTRRNPGYAEAWQELAKLWLERGDTREAHHALLEAEHLDPNNTRVREQLAHVEGMLRAAQRGRAEAEAAVVRMLGNEAWLSLNEAGRLALVAAEVSWRLSRRSDGVMDFGPVVGQQARAVELGLHRRLFLPFRELLLRTAGRDGLRRATTEEVDSALLPFLRFLRAPQGGLSLGPMLAVADAVLAGGAGESATLALLRRFLDDAYPDPARVRDLLADPGLRMLNAIRNQGLHRSTVDLSAASRCRSFLLGDAPGRGWLTAMTRTLAPRPIEDLAASWA